MTGQRFLTQYEKDNYIKEWEDGLTKYEWQRYNSKLGGRGYPDADIVPWCQKINLLNGVCTLQSCAGHKYDENEYYYPGELWLRFDQHMNIAFENKVLKFVKNSLIEKVSKLYRQDGTEIIEIIFQGNERGKFHESIEFIYNFISSLENKVEQDPNV